MSNWYTVGHDPDKDPRWRFADPDWCLEELVHKKTHNFPTKVGIKFKICFFKRRYCFLNNLISHKKNKIKRRYCLFPTKIGNKF